MSDDASREAVSATLRLQFLRHRIDVTTNSLRLASRLQAYFRDYLAPAGSGAAPTELEARVGPVTVDESSFSEWRPTVGKRTPKESVQDRGGLRLILKNRTGVLITIGPGIARIQGDLEQHTNQVVNLVGTLFGLPLLGEGYVMVHASAVVRVRDQAGFIFLGNSGSGKSSLALQLVEAGGYAFVSNDRVLLRVERDGVAMIGLPKKPRVNPGTLLASAALKRLIPPAEREAYAALSAAELWELEKKTDVDVERHLGARSILGARLLRAYSLQWKQGGEGLEQRRLSPDEVVEALRITAKDFGPYDLDPVHAEPLAQYLQMGSAAEFIGVTGRADPTAFARTLATDSQD